MPIRKFEKADIVPLKEIIRATKVFTQEEIEVAVELMEFAANDKNQKEYFIYTYVDEKDAIQGYYCFGPTPLTKGTFDLYWIVVRPDAQRKRIGENLLKHCEEQVRSMGGKLIIIETSSQPKYEATRSFYKKHNYKEEAHIKDYYALGDDLIIYTKHL